MTVATALAASLLAALVGVAAPADTDTPTGTLIVLNKSDATASLIDAATGESWAVLPTGDGPHEVAVSPDGKTAVVADYGASTPGHTLTVLDLTAGTVRTTIDLEANERPHGIQFTGADELLVTCETRNRIVHVDVGAGRVKRTIPTEAPGSHMLVAAASGDRAYTANMGNGSVSVLDLGTAEHVATLATGAQCEGLDVSPDGKEVWTGNRAADTLSVIDTESLEVVATIPCGTFPIRVKFTPDGSRVLVSNAVSSEVAVFDAATREEVGRIAIDLDVVDEAGERLFGEDMAGSPTPIGILPLPGGTRAFVAAANADRVLLLDLREFKVLRGDATGKQPDGLGWTPLGRPSEDGDG